MNNSKILNGCATVQPSAGDTGSNLGCESRPAVSGRVNYRAGRNTRPVATGRVRGQPEGNISPTGSVRQGQSSKIRKGSKRSGRRLQPPTTFGLPILNGNLPDTIASAPNIDYAWSHVRKDLKKAPGIDGETITEAFDKYLKDKDAFCRCIREGRWKPYPVRRVEIPKASGGSRPLGIPTVYDRVVQRAIQQVIEPMIDPFFSEHSYGFRPKRSVHQAARRVRHLIDQGHGYIVDFDLSKFFDTVNHEKLMSILRRIVRDEALLSLIWRFLRAGVMVEMIVQATDEGVPQGGPLSPLLANTFLHLLDFELERRGLQFVRYADDFVIMCRSKRAAYRVLRSVSRYLEGMDLKVNLTKSKVVNATQLVSLGCAFPAGGIRISDQKVESFKQRIFCCLERCPDTTMDLHVARMLKFLSGWRAHYGQLDDKTQLIKLRKWYCGIVRNTMDNYKGSGPDPVAVALHAWPWIPTSHSIHQNHDPDKPGHRRNDIAQQTNNAQAAFHSLDEDALPAGVEVS